MADETTENVVIVEPVRAGSIPQNAMVYPANVVEALVKNAIKRESAERDAYVRAALDKYTSNTLDTKLNALEFKLTDDTGSLKSGINWKGSRASVESLNEIENPKHGDFYVVNGTGYIYTVETVVNPETGEVSYDKYWAAFHNAIDLSNYFTKEETWSKTQLDDLQKLVNRNNEMILKFITQLAVLIDKNELGSGATTEQLSALQGTILNALKNGHSSATRVLDEELGEDTEYHD